MHQIGGGGGGGGGMSVSAQKKFTAILAFQVYNHIILGALAIALGS